MWLIRSALRILIAVTTLFVKYVVPKPLRYNLQHLVVSRNPVMAPTAHQTVTAVDQVNAVAVTLKNVPDIVQDVIQNWIVVQICIAASVGINSMCADVIASERYAITIQTVP